ncbi:hypothetical protein U9R90_05195 [Streptomyces sp. E11-3]|uniref:hypothetical protein n=1 Tax=Streptomyces sp. E11-3 TaxID=3110112 RepID=UPI0039801CF7
MTARLTAQRALARPRSPTLTAALQPAPAARARRRPAAHGHLAHDDSSLGLGEQ